jgi:hypothetical protein
MKDTIARYLRKFVAIVWNKFYFTKYYIEKISKRNRAIVLFTPIVLLLSVNIYFLDNIQTLVEPYFKIKDNLSTLRTILMTVGGALTGALAIVFTLVLFTMQVNIERLPYGLFRKLSEDKKLLIDLQVRLYLTLCNNCGTSSTSNQTPKS